MSEHTTGGARPRREREVLDAAVEAFARHGFAGASVQDVADSVGILKGSLYHYIRSKDELLFRLLSEIHDDVERILEEVRDVPDLSPLQRLSLYVERQVVWNLANLARISIYYHDVRHLAGEQRQTIFARRKLHERFVADLVVDAQRAGEADADLDPELAAYCVFSTIIWTYRWARPDHMDPADLARTCALFATTSLLPAR
jgi:AcrR family transcriptional regulator